MSALKGLMNYQEAREQQPQTMTTAHFCCNSSALCWTNTPTMPGTPPLQMACFCVSGHFDLKNQNPPFKIEISRQNPGNNNILRLPQHKRL